MTKEAIINFIKENEGAGIAEIQQKFKVAYKEIKPVIDELVSGGDLKLGSGVKYVCSNRNECKAAFDKHKNGAFRGEGDLFAYSAQTNRAKFEASCQEFFKNFQDETDVIKDEDDYDDDDDEYVEYDKQGEDTPVKILINVFQNRAIETVSNATKQKAAVQRLVSVLDKIAVKKSAPISAEVVPYHLSWTDEYEFEIAVADRMERLIKSDKRMGKRGAIRKAEVWLDAVRDTHDRKMMQVYERLVYEIKNTGSYFYGQLKKQFFD